MKETSTLNPVQRSVREITSHSQLIEFLLVLYLIIPIRRLLKNLISFCPQTAFCSGTWKRPSPSSFSRRGSLTQQSLPARLSILVLKPRWPEVCMFSKLGLNYLMCRINSLKKSELIKSISLYSVMIPLAGIHVHLPFLQWPVGFLISAVVVFYLKHL